MADIDELIKRLRETAKGRPGPAGPYHDCGDAADALAALRKENERLRAAMELASQCWDWDIIEVALAATGEEGAA